MKRIFKSRKAAAGSVLAVPVLAVPLAAGSMTAIAAVDENAAVSTRVAKTPRVVTQTVDAKANAKAGAYWTPKRMADAKPLMPMVKRTRANSGLARRPDAAGKPVTVAPTAPGKAKNAASTASVPTPAIHGRAYDYPAPFTRFETFPATSYRAYPNRTVGKLFFSNAAGQDFVCSASVVNSENKDIVWTAGHCVSNGAGAFYRNWRFAPARRLGANPYGVWAPRRVATLTEWHSLGNLRQDVGALVMRNNASGASIANAIGALGLQFNASRIRSWNAMGYPAAAPFSTCAGGGLVSGFDIMNTVGSALCGKAWSRFATPRVTWK